MIERLIVWGIGRAVCGPGRGWIWTALAVRGLRMVRSTTGRREVVDIGKLKPGERVVIEHREISHGKQIKQFKAQAKAEKRERKAATTSAHRRAGRRAGKLEA